MLLSENKNQIQILDLLYSMRSLDFFVLKILASSKIAKILLLRSSSPSILFVQEVQIIGKIGV